MLVAIIEKFSYNKIPTSSQVSNGFRRDLPTNVEEEWMKMQVFLQGSCVSNNIVKMGVRVFVCLSVCW